MMSRESFQLCKRQPQKGVGFFLAIKNGSRLSSFMVSISSAGGLTFPKATAQCLHYPAAIEASIPLYHRSSKVSYC